MQAVVVRTFGPPDVLELELAIVLGPEEAGWIERARTALDGPGADRVFDNVGGSLGELAAVADGRCTPVIGQTYPLPRAAVAHAAIDARTVFAKTLTP